VYERGAIAEWFRRGRTTSPATNAVLPSLALVPEGPLKRAIDEYVSRRPELMRAEGERRSFEEAAETLQADLLRKQATGAAAQATGAAAQAHLSARLMELAGRLLALRVEESPPRPAAEVRQIAAAVGAAFGVAGALDADAGDRDVVVHASGAAAGAATALELAGDEAVVVEASWHGSNIVPLPLGGPFHARRLTLRSSQVGNLPPAKRPRWTYARRMGLALKLAGDASLDVLFERDEIAFEDLPAALPRICGARAGAAGLCHRVVYG